MGAYFEGCIYNKQKNRWERIKNRFGLKLLEHSYLNDSYVNEVITECGTDGTNLIWLCDYHDGEITWENTIELFNLIPEQKRNKFKYILNKTKKMFIDINSLKKIHEEIDDRMDLKFFNKGWHIHPIPILCNSDKDYQGGGDFRKRDMRRASWSGDIIAYSQDYPRDRCYRDVTYDVVFREEDEMNLLFDLLDGEKNEYYT